MSRVSKKRLLEILKGEDTVPTNVWEWFSKPISQERWLKEYKKWKKDFKIEAQARSEDAEKYEKQMQRARAVVAARERSRGAARETKDKTLVSKAVGRAEEALIRRLSEELEAAGWKTGSLS